FLALRFGSARGFLSYCHDSLPILNDSRGSRTAFNITALPENSHVATTENHDSEDLLSAMRDSSASPAVTSRTLPSCSRGRGARKWSSRTRAPIRVRDSRKRLTRMMRQWTCQLSLFGRLQARRTIIELRRYAIEFGNHLIRRIL